MEQRQVRDGAKLRGTFEVECWRWHDQDGKRFRDSLGRFERRLMWEEKCHNLINNEGLNRLLNVMLHGATQTATWYCAIVETDTAPSAAQTYDVPVYTECTSYDGATRPEYVEAESTAQSTTNSASKASFTINATKTIYGAALVSINTKGDHAAQADSVLFCYATFASARSCFDDDVLNLTYTCGAADDTGV